jgi:quinol monooxygenase YgiN
MLSNRDEEKIVMSQGQKTPIDELREQVSRMLDGMDPKKPIASTVAFRVNPAKERVYIKESDALAHATRRLPGCNIYAYHEHKPWNDGQIEAGVVKYLIYEDWESVEQFRAQWDSEHLKHFQGILGDLLLGLPDLNFYYGWSDLSAGGRIPKTGQRQCYSSSGVVIPCAGTGQDGAFKAGAAWPSPRFMDNCDGTVTDRLTELIWLKDADRFGEVTWEQALANARGLASGSCDLTDGSKAGDWRLPTIRELLSLIDYSAADPIIPTDHPFTNVRTSIYWTSTTLTAAPSLAWMMTMGIGPIVFDLKINPNQMWPVRGKSAMVPQTGQKRCYDPKNPNLLDPFQDYPCDGTGQDGEIRPGATWPNPRFTDNGDGTVTDNMTGLVWLKNANPFGLRTWEQALKDCNSLSSGSYGLSDGSKPGVWRLPNIREIESLVDYGSFAPSLPDRGEPFKNVRPSSYWTSTSVARAPAQAMFIILGVGPTIFENKEHPFFVWPVRNR